ncbi:MAG: 4-(cytidine 5'-diphospho)-2-C-methyl-D-erythritol kinase [Thermotogota bacterium]
MSKEEHLRSYGKLNLYLDVLDKRSDGYHDIMTLFQRIEVHDDIYIVENGEGNNTFKMIYERSIPFKPQLNWDGNNTLFRALKAVEKYIGQEINGYHITLKKRLPPESGLGGASSNAAELIRFFSGKYRIPFHEMVEIAKEIGADVPFFFYGNTALGTNRGDDVKPLDPLPPYPVIVCQPSVTFSTQNMYSIIDSLRYEDWDNVEDVKYVTDFDDDHEEEMINDPVLDDWEDEDVESWVPEEELYRTYDALKEGEMTLTFNDFEKAAEEFEMPTYESFIKKFTDIKCEEMLLKGMTGSGSAHFIVFNNTVKPHILEEIVQKLREMTLWVKKTNFY